MHGSVSIVIATRLGHAHQARRARDAYAAETPGFPEIIIVCAPTVSEAWQQAITAGVSGDLVHFSCDELEPHPGWIEAAKAAIATKRVPAPTLWGYDGAAPTYARDWSSTLGSEFPTLSRAQLRATGIPPLTFDAAEFVLRTEYAFTRWD